MTRLEFLETLRRRLAGLPVDLQHVADGLRRSYRYALQRFF